MTLGPETHHMRLAGMRHALRQCRLFQNEATHTGFVSHCASLCVQIRPKSSFDKKRINNRTAVICKTSFLVNNCEKAVKFCGAYLKIFVLLSQVHFCHGTTNNTNLSQNIPFSSQALCIKSTRQNRIRFVFRFGLISRPNMEVRLPYEYTCTEFVLNPKE